MWFGEKKKAHECYRLLFSFSSLTRCRKYYEPYDTERCTDFRLWFKPAIIFTFSLGVMCFSMIEKSSSQFRNRKMTFTAYEWVLFKDNFITCTKSCLFLSSSFSHLFFVFSFFRLFSWKTKNGTRYWNFVSHEHYLEDKK